VQILVADQLSRIQRVVAQLGRNGLRVQVLDSDQYPSLGVPQPAFVVVVGPFDTKDDATAACADLGFPAGSCLARRPGPRR
jgi:hypothetical protein